MHGEKIMPTTIEGLAEQVSQLEQSIYTLEGLLAAATDAIQTLRTEIAVSVRTERLSLTDASNSSGNAADIAMIRARDAGLVITNLHGSLEIGPKNQWWSHFLTSQEKYYFDKPVAVAGGQIASYEGDLNLLTNLNAGGNPRVTIANESGNVGVGTTNPSERLHVDGNVRVDGQLHVKNANGSIEIGPQNTGTCHVVTDRENYYLNKEVMVDSGRIGSYDEDLVLCTRGVARAAIRQDTGDLELKAGLIVQQGPITLAGVRIRVVELEYYELHPSTVAVGNTSIRTTASGNWYETNPGGDWRPSGKKKKALKIGDTIIH